MIYQDYLLWNRLGSSLSNGSKPEEALGAYREALQLRPTYTRAIYNVGVACTYLAVCVFSEDRSGSPPPPRRLSAGLNIGLHKEAAEHMLGALAMQEVSGGAKSEQLWYTLRRVFQSMVGPCASRAPFFDLMTCRSRAGLSWLIWRSRQRI